MLYTQYRVERQNTMRSINNIVSNIVTVKDVNLTPAKNKDFNINDQGDRFLHHTTRQRELTYTRLFTLDIINDYAYAADIDYDQTTQLYDSGLDDESFEAVVNGYYEVFTEYFPSLSLEIQYEDNKEVTLIASFAANYDEIEDMVWSDYTANVDCIRGFIDYNSQVIWDTIANYM